MNAFTRKTVIFIVVMALVGFGGWFGRKMYRKATEHRLIAEAGVYLQKNNVGEASLCLERALQINPLNVDANKLTADMLEEAGSPAALNWRVRTAELQTNNMEYRLAWARTALKMNDLSSALLALRGLDQKSRSTVEFHKLAGALAWNLHDPADAEREYAAALQSEPTNQAVTLNLATIRLVSTNRAVADQARSTLEEIPASSPLHLTALRDLVSDATTHKSFKRALYYSQEIVNDPKANFDDKLDHLQMLRLAGDPGFDAWQAKLVKDVRRSPDLTYALGHWMEQKESPATALGWLHSLPATMQTNQPVPLAITECQVAMKDWQGLLSTVDVQDWDQLNYFRFCLESLANRGLGNTMDAGNAWQRAFALSTHHLDRLTRLDHWTTSWGWNQERSDVLQEIVSEFPQETWASQQLATVLYATGQTRALADLFDHMYANDPSNIMLKNNLATVLLLLKSDMSKADRLASESYQSAPDNPFFACTYAYSLLLQSKPQEALKVISSVKTAHLKDPSVAAYYGIVESEAGNGNLAKAPLKLAESARLLPEEMQLVRQAEQKL